MILRILILLSILLVVGCSSDQPEKAAKKPPKSVSKKVKKKSSLIKYATDDKPKEEKGPKNPITDENVEERLLAFGKENRETVVDIYTSKGKIRARLYKETPLHRANFLLMSKRGFLNGSIFTRVAPGFIAQSGGTFDEDHAKIKKQIGTYTIPAEFSKNRIHKKGALATARRYGNNPEKRSDPAAFYFVEGTQYNDPTLDVYERDNNYVYSKFQREYYRNNPGAAHLDGQHTVFGEIISGNSVVSKITHVPTDSRDWPYEDIFIDSVIVIR